MKIIPRKKIRLINYVLMVALGLSLIGNMVLCTNCFKVKVTVAKVDADYLMQQLVKDIAKQNLGEQETKEATKAKLAQLDKLLEQIAAQENLVIIPAKAVIAGGIDLTRQIEAIMEQENEKAH